MKKFVILSVSLISWVVLFSSVYASQISFSTSGDVSVGYQDIGGNTYSASDHYDEGQADSFANANFGDPALVYGFSFSKTSGVNSVGAKSGVGVNSVRSGSGILSFDAAPKRNTNGHAAASAQATNRYYYAGMGTNALATISMDFLYDGQVLALMDGLVAPGEPGSGPYFGEISYRIHASVASEGLWNPDGLGWQWSFSEQDSFFLEYDDDELDPKYYWRNENGDELGELGEAIAGTKSMDMTLWDHGMLQGANASFLVTYGIDVMVDFGGLSFEEDGYLYTRSDFYDTLGVEIRSANILEEPSPVPIPGTMILLGTGLIGLAGARKKFKK